MKHVILTAAGCSLLLGSTALGQSLSDRIDHVMQKRAALQQNSDNQAQMLGTLMYTDLTVQFDDTALRDAINYLETVLGISIVGRYNDDRVAEGLDPDAEISLDVQEKPAITVLEMILAQASDDISEATWQLREGYIEVGTKERLGSRTAQQIRYYPIRDLLMVIPYFDNAPSVDLDTALGQGGGSGSGGGGFGGGSGGGGGGFGGGGGGGSGGGGGGSGGGQNIFDEPGEDPERLSEEERAQQIIDLIVEIVEPDAWEINGGDWASIRYYQGTLIVRAPDFIHRQIVGYPFTIRPPAANRYIGGSRYITFTGGFSQVEVTDIKSVPVSGAAGGTAGTP